MKTMKKRDSEIKQEGNSGKKDKGKSENRGRKLRNKDQESSEKKEEENSKERGRKA